MEFAVFSERATAIDLCLFAAPGDAEESRRIPLDRTAGGVWRAWLAEARPGQLYGYRAHGPFAPEEGLRFNPAKLLIDPWTRALSGGFSWSDALLGYTRGHLRADLSLDPRDSAGFVPKSRVVEDAFDWGDDRPPGTPWDRTVIYELHVRGMTVRHPKVPEPLRGTYLGLAREPVIDHLLKLGVTAVELLPVHAALTDGTLVERGLTNYWGYQTLGFFAPEARYATGSDGRQVAEFQAMVRALHRAGIEVILDVVFNHTAEGSQLGPTVAFRGLDNASYYRLVPGNPRYYVDFTGCGNTLDANRSAVLDLVLASLRYWVRTMHVDGFRFDLAPALGREQPHFSEQAPFFRRIAADPVVGSVKLIAEPWDVGDGGGQQGAFPPGWSEWNGRFRDGVRRFWRGDAGRLGDLAARLGGSDDLFAAAGRGPEASINFVTCHDGFTLQDLVSYERKRNEINGEGNRDGTDEDHAHGWGAEGPTRDLEILALRDRVKRNLLATLAFSHGVPMLSHGDEIGRSQAGNNNAYCQDNEIAWVDWQLQPRDTDLLAFARHVFALRRRFATLRPPRFRRRAEPGNGPDPQWLGADGREMAPEDWAAPAGRLLGMLLRDGPEADGAPAEALLVLLNADVSSRFVRLPRLPGPGTWTELLNTARSGERLVTGDGLNLVAHSLILLRHGTSR